MILLIMLLRSLAFLLFVLLTSYVLLFGKASTGMKLDYLFTALFIIGVIFVL